VGPVLGHIGKEKTGQKGGGMGNVSNVGKKESDDTFILLLQLKRQESEAKKTWEPKTVKRETGKDRNGAIVSLSPPRAGGGGEKD